MKKRMISFNEFLTHVYRQANGQPLDPFTIKDYLSYCNTGGSRFHRGEGGLYWISTLEEALAYEPAFKYECSKYYVEPGNAVRAYSAYMEFIEYEVHERLAA